MGDSQPHKNASFPSTGPNRRSSEKIQKEVWIDRDGTIHLRGMSSKDRSVGDPGEIELLCMELLCMETQVHELNILLKTREIKHFVFGQKPPQTEVKKRLFTMNIDPAFKYLQHLVEAHA